MYRVKIIIAESLEAKINAIKVIAPIAISSVDFELSVTGEMTSLCFKMQLNLNKKLKKHIMGQSCFYERAASVATCPERDFFFSTLTNDIASKKIPDGSAYRHR